MNSPAWGSVGRVVGAGRFGCAWVFAPSTPWPGSVTDGVTALPEDRGALVPSPAVPVGCVVGGASPRRAAAVRCSVGSPAAPRVEADEAEAPLKLAEHPGAGEVA